MSKITLFHSDTCPPCKPTKKALASVRKNGLKKVLVDVDSKKGSSLASKHNIQYTPTMIVESSKGNKRVVGSVTKKRIEGLL